MELTDALKSLFVETAHALSGVMIAMMTIRLTQGLIAAHAINRVFHHNPTSGERPIEGNILGRAVSPAPLAAWGRTQLLPMLLSNADVGQITNPSNASGQSREQYGLFEQGDIGGWSRHVARHIIYFTHLLVDRDLALERMLRFFRQGNCPVRSGNSLVRRAVVD